MNSRSIESRGIGDATTSAGTSPVSPHEAAILLNNLVVSTILSKDQNYQGANQTLRDAICLIKSCIPTNDGDNLSNSNNIHQPSQGPPTITHDDVHEMLQNANRRVYHDLFDSSNVNNVLTSSLNIQVITNYCPFTRSELNPSEMTNTHNETTTQEMIPNNEITVSTKAATTVTISTNGISTNSTHSESSTISSSASSTSSSHMMQYASQQQQQQQQVVTHITTATAATTVTTTTSELLSRLTLEPHQAPTSYAKNILPTTTTETNRSIPTRDEFPILSVYPMTIDDNSNTDQSNTIVINNNNDDDEEEDDDEDDRCEYHAIIILYNYAIVHQCIGMKAKFMLHQQQQQIQNGGKNGDDDDDDDEGHGSLTNLSNTQQEIVTRMDNDLDDDDTINQSSIIQNYSIVEQQQHYHHQSSRITIEEYKPIIQASYTIFCRILSWIHQLVQPVLDDIINNSQQALGNNTDNNDDQQYDHEYEDYMDDEMNNNLDDNNNDLDPNRSQQNPISETTISTTNRDLHYVQMMILIHYHVIDIIIELQLPIQYYEYHTTMIRQLLHVLPYLEDNDHMTQMRTTFDYSNVMNTTSSRSASPAA